MALLQGEIDVSLHAGGIIVTEALRCLPGEGPGNTSGVMLGMLLG